MTAHTLNGGDLWSLKLRSVKELEVKELEARSGRGNYFTTRDSGCVHAAARDIRKQEES
jgi:hypothetical protein